jgi:hypothetical protein
MELLEFIQTELNITHGEIMAQQVSGFTTNYTDPQSGLNIPEAWIQINTIQYRPYDHTLIAVDIYENLASKESGMAPIFQNIQMKISYGSSDWDSYFDPDAMDIAGHNIQKQCIGWLEVNITTARR